MENTSEKIVEFERKECLPGLYIPRKHSAQRRGNVKLSKAQLTKSCCWSAYFNIKPFKLMMEEGFVTVNQVPTRVITFGGWINQPIKGNKLIVMIPGNPGLIGYYEVFLQCLYQNLKGECSIWGLGHAGHEVPPGSVLPSIKDRPHLFTLGGQINHKIDFINTYVPKGTQLYFIGHSIGSKIVLSLVNKFGLDHHTTGYLLFPTCERMAQTPSGRKLWPMLGPLRRIVVMGATLLHQLPETWLTRIVHWFMKSKGTGSLAVENATAGPLEPHHVSVKTTVKLLNPHALEKSLFMANDELQVVCELDTEEIRRSVNRLTFYFGRTDHWCPLEYHDNLKRLVPEARAFLCQHGMEHAFVLRSSELMATIVAEWIANESSQAPL